MNVIKPSVWCRAVILAVPVIAVQVSVSRLQTDVGLQPLAAAVAQEQQSKPRETRRTPAHPVSRAAAFRGKPRKRGG